LLGIIDNDLTFVNRVLKGGIEIYHFTHTVSDMGVLCV